MPEAKHFTVEHEDGVTVVRLLDPMLLDTLIVSEFQDELLEHLDEEKPPKLIVVFDSVSLCSTAVINGVLRAKKRLMEWNGQIKLCGMLASVREAYRLLNLDGPVFQIYDTREDALAAF